MNVDQMLRRLPVTGLRTEISRVLPLVVEAGNTALRYYAGDIQVHFKGQGDPVTLADRDINAFLVQGLRHAFPEDAVLAEESADEPATRVHHRRLWCVDPLDGTQEFTEHVDHQWAIMVGLAVSGTAVLGLVYPPTCGQLLLGVTSEGAWLWDDGKWRPLQVSDVRDPGQATIAVSRSHRSQRIDAIIRHMGIRQEVRYGSVGMKVSLLATRQADVYIHPTPGTKEWDLCAPEAILKAAGGEMTDMFGRPLRYNKPDPANPHGLVASNGYLHAAALEAVRQTVLSAQA